MHKFHFDPVVDDDPKELIWHNIEQADKYYKTDIFIGASMAWFKENPGKNYYDFEIILRNRKLNTHLYAKKHILENNQELKFHNSDQECLYKCIFCCKPKELALQEVIKECNSYEDNLENLKKTGVLCLKNIEKIEKIQELNNEEKGRMEKLKNLEVKIRVVEISAENIIDDISKEIEKQFNKEPDIMIVGQLPDNIPIYAFTLENRLISDIGFSVKQTPNGPEYEIIQLEHTENS